MKSFNSGWYVIYTRTNQESKLANQLIDRNIDCYLPKIKVHRQWHDRKKIIYVPVFPSYLFVFLNDINDFYNSKDTNGFCAFVKCGKSLSIVSQELIDQLKMVLGSGEKIDITSEIFIPGQKLFIQNGSLSGLHCEVISVERKNKILVRIDMLSRCLLIDMPLNCLMEEVWEERDVIPKAMASLVLN